MKFEKIQPGMVLYDVHSQKMGNTSLRTLGTWSVKVHEVDSVRRRALCSWNGNRPEWWSELRLSKLKDKRPILIRTSSGTYRRPTKEELAQIKASASSSETGQQENGNER